MDAHSTSFPTTPSSTIHLSASRAWRQTTLYQFNRLRQAIIGYLTQNPDPRITEECDRDGHHFWNIYDPLTNQRTTCSSAAEVRFWLEQRYNLH